MGMTSVEFSFRRIVQKIQDAKGVRKTGPSWLHCAMNVLADAPLGGADYCPYIWSGAIFDPPRGFNRTWGGAFA